MDDTITVLRTGARRKVNTTSDLRGTNASDAANLRSYSDPAVIQLSKDNEGATWYTESNLGGGRTVVYCDIVTQL